MTNGFEMLLKKLEEPFTPPVKQRDHLEEFVTAAEENGFTVHGNQNVVHASYNGNVYIIASRAHDGVEYTLYLDPRNNGTAYYEIRKGETDDPAETLTEILDAVETFSAYLKG